MSPPTKCPVCEGVDLTWDHAIVGGSSIPEGRHKVNELHVVAFLGCNGCSETLLTVELSEFMAWALERRRA